MRSGCAPVSVPEAGEDAAAGDAPESKDDRLLAEELLESDDASAAKPLPPGCRLCICGG